MFCTRFSVFVTSSVCLQSPSFLLITFCGLHWPLCKKLDLSFIWGHHHLHLVDDQPINWLLHYLQHRGDETQQGWKSCPGLQFLAFGLDYHVFVPLSFLRRDSISLGSLLLFPLWGLMANQIFYRSYVILQQLCLRSFASLCLDLPIVLFEKGKSCVSKMADEDQWWTQLNSQNERTLGILHPVQAAFFPFFFIFQI